MGNIDCVKKKIGGIIEKSLVPEDLIHAKNTLEWLLKLKSDADDALKIAALGHDIERASEERKVRRKDYKNYDEFKNAHSLNSARILVEIMEDCHTKKQIRERVFYLVSHHEIGGCKGADVLRDADTISFFHVNLSYYFARNGIIETKKRVLWGYKKLPSNLRKVVKKFHCQPNELVSLVKNWISNFESKSI